MTNAAISRVLGCALIAFLTTLFAYFLDVNRLEGRLADRSLAWARALSHQVKSGAPNYEEAIRALTPQDPRVPFRVYLARFDELDQKKEIYHFSFEKGEFDYAARIPGHADQLAIRVKFFLGFFGFLGTRDRTSNNVAVLIVFGFFFWMAYLLTAQGPMGRVEDQVRLGIRAWISQSEANLLSLSHRLKGVLEGSKDFIETLIRMHRQLIRLRVGIEKEGQMTQDYIHSLSRVSESAKTAEAVLLDQIQLLKKAGVDRKDIAIKMEEIQSLLKEIHQTAAHVGGGIQSLSGQITEWNRTVESSECEYQSVLDQKKKIQEAIHQTTHLMRDHVDQFENLGAVVSSDR